ncbi:hypothetical protein [Streptomyces mirabilis]|uniref:hypothetical protein n=1 Tax=Streptomyces mirabilis TaxID=68239 RepID=UPI00364F347D
MTRTDDDRAENRRLRDARRETLFVLLARADRKALSTHEAVLLRANVEAEITESDQARRIAAEETEEQLAESEAHGLKLANHLAAAQRECAAPHWPALADTVKTLRKRAEQAEQQVAAVRALLPAKPRPALGLPNDLAYANGTHDAYDAVRDALDQH